MRLLVCGSRDFAVYPPPNKRIAPGTTNKKSNEVIRFNKEYGFILNEISKAINWVATQEDMDSWLPPAGTVIISGGAKGVDTAAIEWAVVNWTQFEEYKAEWDKYNKAAGPIRNQRMLDEGKPDKVLAINGGRGTADMVRRAKKAGIPVIEVRYDPN